MSHISQKYFFTSFWAEKPFKKNMTQVFDCFSQYLYIYWRILFHIHHAGRHRVLTSVESESIFSFSFSLQHMDSWSLISRSHWTSSWRYVSCRYYLKEWEGCTAHLRRNVIRLVRALFRRVHCFFTSVFLAFIMWPYGIPKTVCLPIMDSGSGYQGEETFLSGSATHEYFHLSTV